MEKRRGAPSDIDMLPITNGVRSLSTPIACPKREGISMVTVGVFFVLSSLIITEFTFSKYVYLPTTAATLSTERHLVPTTFSPPRKQQYQSFTPPSHIQFVTCTTDNNTDLYSLRHLGMQYLSHSVREFLDDTPTEKFRDKYWCKVRFMHRVVHKTPQNNSWVVFRDLDTKFSVSKLEKFLQSVEKRNGNSPFVVSTIHGEQKLMVTNWFAIDMRQKASALHFLHQWQQMKLHANGHDQGALNVNTNCSNPLIYCVDKFTVNIDETHCRGRIAATLGHSRRIDCMKKGIHPNPIDY